MAKNSHKKAVSAAEAEVESVLTPAEASAPDFQSIIAAAKKAQDEANEMAAAAKSAMAEANAAVEGIVAPYKERRKVEVLDPRAKEQERHATRMKELSDKDEAIIAEVAALGIDKVFLGVAPVRKPKGEGTTGGGKNVKLSDLDGIDATVSAPQRTGKGEVIDVHYTIFGEDGVDDAGNAIKSFKARGQRVGKETVREGNLTEAASLAGWHNVKDVSYALLALAGKLAEYPDVQPHSDPSLIMVDGKPVNDYVSQ
jgi:hypothetical protein